MFRFEIYNYDDLPQSLISQMTNESFSTDAVELLASDILPEHYLLLIPSPEHEEPHIVASSSNAVVPDVLTDASETFRSQLKTYSNPKATRDSGSLNLVNSSDASTKLGIQLKNYSNPMKTKKRKPNNLDCMDEPSELISSNHSCNCNEDSSVISYSGNAPINFDVSFGSTSKLANNPDVGHYSKNITKEITVVNLDPVASLVNTKENNDSSTSKSFMNPNVIQISSSSSGVIIPPNLYPETASDDGLVTTIINSDLKPITTNNNNATYESNEISIDNKDLMNLEDENPCDPKNADIHMDLINSEGKNPTVSCDPQKAPNFSINSTVINTVKKNFNVNFDPQNTTASALLVHENPLNSEEEHFNVNCSSNNNTDKIPEVHCNPLKFVALVQDQKSTSINNTQINSDNCSPISSTEIRENKKSGIVCRFSEENTPSNKTSNCKETGEDILDLNSREVQSHSLSHNKPNCLMEDVFSPPHPRLDDKSTMKVLPILNSPNFLLKEKYKSLLGLELNLNVLSASYSENSHKALLECEPNLEKLNLLKARIDKLKLVTSTGNNDQSSVAIESSLYTVQSNPNFLTKFKNLATLRENYKAMLSKRKRENFKSTIANNQNTMHEKVISTKNVIQNRSILQSKPSNETKMKKLSILKEKFTLQLMANSKFSYKNSSDAKKHLDMQNLRAQRKEQIYASWMSANHAQSKAEQSLNKQTQHTNKLQGIPRFHRGKQLRGLSHSVIDLEQNYGKQEVIKTIAEQLRKSPLKLYVQSKVSSLAKEKQSGDQDLTSAPKPFQLLPMPSVVLDAQCRETSLEEEESNSHVKIFVQNKPNNNSFNEKSKLSIVEQNQKLEIRNVSKENNRIQVKNNFIPSLLETCTLPEIKLSQRLNCNPTNKSFEQLTFPLCPINLQSKEKSPVEDLDFHCKIAIPNKPIFSYLNFNGKSKFVGVRENYEPVIHSAASKSEIGNQFKSSPKPHSLQLNTLYAWNTQQRKSYSGKASTLQSDSPVKIFKITKAVPLIKNVNERSKCVHVLHNKDPSICEAISKLEKINTFKKSTLLFPLKASAQIKRGQTPNLILNSTSTCNFSKQSPSVPFHEQKNYKKELNSQINVLVLNKSLPPPPHSLIDKSKLVSVQHSYDSRIGTVTFKTETKNRFKNNSSQHFELSSETPTYNKLKLNEWLNHDNILANISSHSKIDPNGSLNRTNQSSNKSLKQGPSISSNAFNLQCRRECFGKESISQSGSNHISVLNIVSPTNRILKKKIKPAANNRTQNNKFTHKASERDVKFAKPFKLESQKHRTLINRNVLNADEMSSNINFQKDVDSVAASPHQHQILKRSVLRQLLVNKCLPEEIENDKVIPKRNNPKVVGESDVNLQNSTAIYPDYSFKTQTNVDSQKMKPLFVHLQRLPSEIINCVSSDNFEYVERKVTSEKLPTVLQKHRGYNSDLNSNQQKSKRKQIMPEVTNQLEKRQKITESQECSGHVVSKDCSSISSYINNSDDPVDMDGSTLSLNTDTSADTNQLEKKQRIDKCQDYCGDTDVSLNSKEPFLENSFVSRKSKSNHQNLENKKSNFGEAENSEYCVSTKKRSSVSTSKKLPTSIRDHVTYDRMFDLWNTKVKLKSLRYQITSIKTALKAINKSEWQIAPINKELRIRLFKLPYLPNKIKVSLVKLPDFIYDKHKKNKPIMLSNVLPSLQDFCNENILVSTNPETMNHASRETTRSHTTSEVTNRTSPETTSYTRTETTSHANQETMSHTSPETTSHTSPEITSHVSPETTSHTSTATTSHNAALQKELRVRLFKLPYLPNTPTVNLLKLPEYLYKTYTKGKPIMLSNILPTISKVVSLSEKGPMQVPNIVLKMEPMDEETISN